VKLLFGASDVKLNVRGGLKMTHYPAVRYRSGAGPGHRVALSVP